MAYNHNKFLLKPKPKRSRTLFDQFVIVPREELDDLAKSQIESKQQMVTVALGKHSTKVYKVK